MQVSPEVRGMGSGSGVAGCCDPLSVAAGNQTQVFYARAVCVLNHEAITPAPLLALSMLW